jgi:NADPH:quinone reductase-like Zn-dependent oxidoreductase
MTKAPDQMNAMQATAFSIDALQMAQVPRPRAKPGEIVLKVIAASLNYRDLSIVTGAYFPDLALPYVPASDCVGTVVELGEGVTRFALGDRVIPCYIQGWRDGLLTQEQRKTKTLGAPMTGVLQDYVAVPAEDAVAAPAGLSDEEAATMPIAALTAWHCLQTGGVAAGKTVLTQGTGGVALFALQFAKALGARVVALTSTPEKAEMLRAMGADHVVNYRETPNWAAAVRAATGGKGVEIVVETTGHTLSQSLDACAFNGFVGIIGFVGGTEATVSIRQIIGPKIRMEGIVVGSRAMMETMMQAIGALGIRPIIAGRYPLAQAAEAFRALKAAENPGKIIINLG